VQGESLVSIAALIAARDKFNVATFNTRNDDTRKRALEFRHGKIS
jgi:hypothetical protein